MFLGDFDSARIEFNRALYRSERAKEFFKKELNQKIRVLMEEEKKNNLNLLPYEKEILKEYSNLYLFEGYRGFVNPFVNCMSGIFFLNVKDDKARDLIKECYGITKNSEILKSLDGKKHIWVIVFNGLSVIKKERVFEIPFVSRRIFYIGVALPILVKRDNLFNVFANSKRVTKLSSMDLVIEKEFSKRLPVVIKEELLRVLVQTLIQSEISKNFGSLAGAAFAIYQKAVNRADTRMWSNLPKEFDLLVLDNRGFIEIKKDGKIFKKNLDKNRNYIVLVTRYGVFVKDFK
jgi:hypothetical protein